ncbi:P2Y purinoceptor 6-like [Salmo salar]|uniref:P2Y purinoceptor 6-like n=1 Tax=Salmo salar TaxID=8030 RepID=A0A1S3RE94_SALSA|nr:P2Y purinoceptor 6-like [Salmo salar]|eukprot:XP_014050678.1 PREDICTED: P2Y purinoceptor 6-like [Salmo salar]
MDSSNHSSVLSAYLELDFAVTTACYAVNLILSLPTNGYVLWLILTGAGGTVASEFFALNLAVSEILYCLCAVFVFVYIHLPIPPILALITFFSGFMFHGRPLFQCCICFERYLAVVHPVVFLKYRSLRYKPLFQCCVCVERYLAVVHPVIYLNSLGSETPCIGGKPNLAFATPCYLILSLPTNGYIL